MSYCFANWRRCADGNGREPCLPETLGYGLLAEPDPAGRADWALWHVSFVDDESRCDGLEFVSLDFGALIGSAEGYPPALALARDEVAVVCQGRGVSREEFASAYSALLTKHLQDQPTAPYVLAEARVEEVGYLSKGAFVWILEYLPGRGLVRWVSSDYFVYANPASHFNLTESQLIRLSRL